MSEAFAVFETAIGPCAIAWDGEVVTRVHLPEATLAATRARMAPRGESKPPAWMKKVMARIARHLEGDAQDFAGVPLDFGAAPAFHAKVYDALRAVRAAETVTYAELARRAGSPSAVRAVGQAMAKNPLPILVPCHRVLAAGQKAGGFSAHGGAATKARILAIEGVVLSPGGGTRRAGASDPLFAAAGTRLPFDAEKAVAELSARDKRLGRVMEKVGPLKLTLKETEGAYAALAEAIVYQQLHGKAAATILGRIKTLFARASGANASALRFFSPRHVLEATDADLRGCGLSGNKLAALRDLSEKAESGVIPALPALLKMDDDAIVDRLTQIRGIGRWTVEMMLIFRLGRPDVLPATDYGVRQGFARTYGKKELPAPKDLLAFGERWRPYRTVASWYMWRAMELPAKGE